LIDDEDTRRLKEIQIKFYYVTVLDNIPVGGIRCIYFESDIIGAVEE